MPGNKLSTRGSPGGVQRRERGPAALPVAGTTVVVVALLVVQSRQSRIALQWVRQRGVLSASSLGRFVRRPVCGELGLSFGGPALELPVAVRAPSDEGVEDCHALAFALFVSLGFAPDAV